MMTLLLALLLAPGVAIAQGPQNCTFPSPPDALATANPGDQALPIVNRHACILNRLQQHVLTTAASETVCGDITVSASTRQTFNLTAPATLTGSEVIVPSVRDLVSPHFVEVGPVAAASGTTIALTVFNRDVAAQRTAKLCALIVRP